MLTGTTGSGFQYTLDENVLDDYELLETLTSLDKGDSGEVATMITLLLGREQKDALKEHLRNERGKVPASRMIAEAMEILQSAGQGKNSSSSPA